MGYLNAIQTAIGNLGKLGGVGAPPSPTPSPQVGTPPPANPNASPPPYDSAHDPAWKGLLQHGEDAFRNFLNGLDQDTRVMLLNKIKQALATPPPTAATPTPSPNALQRLLSPGFGAQPPSTSRTPGTF